MSPTSRWDRPPPRRNVRWFVRLVGKTLIVIGLLMFGFVAYQLWGTGIEYARAQNRAENQFEQLMETAGRASTSTAAPATTATTTQPPTTTTSSGSTTQPGNTTSSTTATTATTTLPPTSTSTIPVFDIASLNIEDGQGFAQIEIPRVGLDDIVVAGVTRDDLKQGPGHYPQTPMPGQLGNSAIAGHRTTYGAPFLHIDEIKPGDEIIVTTPYGRFVYVMTEAEIVDPSAWEVIATTDPTKATLTLTSCHPVGTAAQRIIVYAELDLAQSSSPGQPVFNYGRDQAVSATAPTLPGESFTTAAPAMTTSPTSRAAPSTSAAAPATGATAAVPPSTEATTTTNTTTTPGTVTDDSLYSVRTVGGMTGGEDVGADSQAAQDAFSDNWFDDAAAWPHVAFWGGVAAAVVVGAYQLAKLLRNSWIGLAAGVVPFMVVLYFFYQSVNRLLPAAL